MTVFTCLAEHFDVLIVLLTVVLNAAVIGYHVFQLLRGDKGTALSKWLQLLEAARQYEAEAEQFSHYSAAEKLNYVLSRLRTLAAELCYPFEEEKLVAAVEKDIAFSKVVNAADASADESCT